MRTSRKSSTVVLLIVLSLGAATEIGHASETSEQAKVRFDKGVLLFKNGDFDAALVEFRAAYDVAPHYAVKYNIGISLFKLHRYGEAHAVLSEYLFEAGEDVPDEKRVEVEALLEEMQSLTGTLVVKCNVVDALVIVDGEEVKSTMLRLDVGEHLVEVKAVGYLSFRKKLELPSGKPTIIEAVLIKDPDHPKPVEPEEAMTDPVKGSRGKPVPPAVFWCLASLTVASALGASIIGGITLEKEADYAKLDFEDDWQSARSTARKLQLTTNVLWGITGGLSVIAIIIAIFTNFRKKEKSDNTVSLMLDPVNGGLLLGGHF